MVDKANPLVDELNKILTNTLDYREVLQKLSKSVSHETTSKKLSEFAEIKQEESQNLMKVINDLGGQVETNERMTDQQAVCWMPEPIPNGDDTNEVLDKLISAEKNVLNDYNDLLNEDKIDQQHLSVLKKHHQQAEANLKYLRSAKASEEDEA